MKYHCLEITIQDCLEITISIQDSFISLEKTMREWKIWKSYLYKRWPGMGQ